MTSAPLPKVLVAQLGARRHYLVPATFHSRGMLERFVTDVYLPRGQIKRVVRRLSKTIPIDGLRRLAGRGDLHLPNDSVTSFPRFGLEYRIRARLASRRGELTRAWLWAGREFGQRVVEMGWGKADVAYGYSSAALEIFEAAKRDGKLCVLDHATAPRRFEESLTAMQAARYEGWAAERLYRGPLIDEYADRQNREAELADVIICGSTFVKSAVEAESGQGHKVAVVPLGLRSLPTGVVPKRPVHGRRLRILFVGDEAIRKGIGDLCRAVEMFGAHRCEIRVAGNTDLSALGQREAGKTVNFLGPVPRQEMQYQYEWADVVLLPSVSDTFGLVVLEAMSHGVPVITTHNTGGADVVIEGKNGFVVPVMRPDLIARKLEILDSDPYLLAAFSERAIGCSLDFSLDRYAERLTSVVQSAFVNRLAGSHSPCLALSQQASGTPSKF